MNRNIASVKAHTPVLGKLARMRQMQGKASRLDRGLAAFSERVAQRVMRRGIGQWRRFSLDYLMDEEQKETGAQAAGVNQNIDLDVVFNLSAGAQQVGAQAADTERLLERIVMRTVLRMQPEWLMRRYDIHRDAADGRDAAVVRAEENARAEGQAEASALRTEARTLMERALLRERTVERKAELLERETIRAFVTERRGAGDAGAAGKAAVRRESAGVLRVRGAMGRNTQAGAVVREPEARGFALAQMRGSLPMAASTGDAGARAGVAVRAGAAVSARRSEQGARPTGTAVAGAMRIGLPSALPEQADGNARLAREIRLRSRLGAETLVHAQADGRGNESAGLSEGAETGRAVRGEEARRERGAAARTAVLWRVLERTGERMLRSVERSAVLPGAAGLDGRDGERGRNALREVRLRSRFGVETLVHPGAERVENEIETLREVRSERGTALERVFAERAQVLRRVLERSSERMVRSVVKATVLPGAFGADGLDGAAGLGGAAGSAGLRGRDGLSAVVPGAAGLRGVDGSAGTAGARGSDGRTVLTERVLGVPGERRAAAGRDVLREVQLRSRFGLETLVYPGSERVETDNETLREVLAERETAREWASERVRLERAQVLRRVLERSSERMVRSVERATALPGAAGSDGADGAAGVRGSDGRTALTERVLGVPGERRAAAGQDVLREVQLRSRFGLETLVYPEAGAAVGAEAGAEALNGASSERGIERKRILMERVRLERAQVLRRVLERSSERMVRSVERATALPGAAGLDGLDGAAGRSGAAGAAGLRGADGFAAALPGAAGLRGADGAAGAAGMRGSDGRAGLTERLLGVPGERRAAGRDVLREVQLRSRFGLETLVYPGSERVETENGTLREVRTEREVALERASERVREVRAQVLRQVLERTSERMVRSVERTMGLPGAAGMDGADGSAGMNGLRGRDGRLGRTVRGADRAAVLPGAVGLRGAAGLDGADGAAGLRGADGRLARTVRLEDVPGERMTERSSSPGRDVLREVQLRSRFGLETLVYPEAEAAGGAEALNGASPERGIERERILMERVRQERALALRQVLERSSERMLRSVERTALSGTEGAEGARGRDGRSARGMRGAAGAAALSGRDGRAGLAGRTGRDGADGRSAGGVQRAADGLRGAAGMDGMRGADGRPGRVALLREWVPGARAASSAEREVLREVQLRSLPGYEALIYPEGDGVEAAGVREVMREVRTERASAAVRAERGQALRQVLERSLRTVERRGERLLAPGRQQGMRPVMQPARVMARPLRTAVEGQAGMTMLMRRREDAPRSTLEMIARAGEADSPLRSTILTQPAEIVMYVPPSTMSVYGAETPRVGNLTWDSAPGPEGRSGPEAALRLMQKAQQKFGAQARYRPPEMVMRERGDATGKLASQQQGQPANINQQMRAKKTVVRESAQPELSGAEITRIVDKVYDKLERKIAAEYRRRGR